MNNVFNKTIYNILCLARNNKTINVVNKLANIDNYNIIIPNLYLGNIKYAYNKDFLIENNIGAIINCTENEQFDDYFDDKQTFRLAINDSKDKENINKFKNEILNAVYFIENALDNNIPIYIHCYWGLMRSATVVAAYLIKKYNLSIEDAIHIIREQRPCALVSFYNFNEVLKYVKSEK